jgi:hypothetical protein
MAMALAMVMVVVAATTSSSNGNLGGGCHGTGHRCPLLLAATLLGLSLVATITPSTTKAKRGVKIVVVQQFNHVCLLLEVGTVLADGSRVLNF